MQVQVTTRSTNLRAEHPKSFEALDLTSNDKNVGRSRTFEISRGFTIQMSLSRHDLKSLISKSNNNYSLCDGKQSQYRSSVVGTWTVTKIGQNSFQILGHSVFALHCLTGADITLESNGIDHTVSSGGSGSSEAIGLLSHLPAERKSIFYSGYSSYFHFATTAISLGPFWHLGRSSLHLLIFKHHQKKFRKS